MNNFIFLTIAIILFFSQNTKALKFLPINKNSFDSQKAKDFWFYEVASYCTQNNILNWNVSTVAQKFPNVQQVNVFMNSSGENQAYTAYDESNDRILVAVRGSANIENWFENLDAFRTTYDKCDGCEVHAGFHDAYLDLKDSLIPSVVSLHDAHPHAEIAVIGHSLGAAIATFIFVDVYETIGYVDYFYTYGSPRVGNDRFSEYMSNNFPNVFKARITHNMDPVPHLPLVSMGFLHIDREVFYVEDDSRHFICNVGEDPNCSNQFKIPADIADHLDYMSFSQHDYKTSCQ